MDTGELGADVEDALVVPTLVELVNGGDEGENIPTSAAREALGSQGAFVRADLDGATWRPIGVPGASEDVPEALAPCVFPEP